MFGLMFRKKPDAGFAMVIPFCNWIHTFFMRFDIDVIYLDADYRVVDSISGLRPWRMTRPRMKAQHVVEFPGETLSGTDIKKGVLVKCLD
jgi:uncharacterized protein